MKNLVANIIAIHNLARPDEVKHGMTWYHQALCECRTIANKHDMPEHIVVGVVAALSPNNRWERNVTNADDLIAAFINGDHIESVKVSTYHTMKAKAWRILEEMPDYAQAKVILNGQKITCFFENIMGENTCTIDGHARNIAYAERIGLTDDKTNIGKKEYALLQDAYRQAANQCDIKAYEMQAITWVAWRRIHGIG